MSVPNRPQRPRIVTLLVWGVFLLGIWNAGRALAVIKESRLLLALAAAPDPRIRIGLALLWTVLFWVLAAALWWRRPFSRRAIPILLTIYALVEGGQQLLFTQVPGNWQARLFTGMLFILVIIAVRWALTRPAAQSYFADRRQHGRNEPQ